MTVICPYCQQPAELVDSAVVYGRSFGPIWLCKPCDAYVGVHKNAKNFAPLGRLANKELREWKKRAHLALDPLWRSGRMKRKEAYAFIQEQMGLEKRDTHIGKFDVAQCQQMIEIVRCHVSIATEVLKERDT